MAVASGLFLLMMRALPSGGTDGGWFIKGGGVPTALPFSAIPLLNTIVFLRKNRKQM
jgi:hypothetical protein